MKVSARDMKAILDYIQAQSIRLRDRVSIFSIPPRGDEDRYTHLSIGRRSNSIEISGYGENFHCSWVNESGERQCATLAELIEEEEDD